MTIRFLPRALALLPLLAPAGIAAAQEAPRRAPANAGAVPLDTSVDAFHPRRDQVLEPAWGGTVNVHLARLPKSLNTMIDNSSYARWLLYELHALLVARDWESWELRPELCTGWDTEDTLVLAGGRGVGNENVLYGAVSDAGEDWLVTPLSSGNPLEEPRRVPKERVESVERGTVFTFHLREGVRWHDGHPFDADDVLFSWKCYRNPGVDCDHARPRFEKVVHAEVLDPHTIRFFYAEQYFAALETFNNLCILPAHLYDLHDPEHPRHDPAASPAAQAKEVNENPHNTDWVGLGPYRLTAWSQEALVAERFEDYYDPEHGGYLDKIRWRHIPDDGVVIQALLNGEIDHTLRIGSDEYYGPVIQGAQFRERFYAGYYFVGSFNYVLWNMRRPVFSDLRVRKALSQAFDIEEYRRTVAHGLANLPTGPMFFYGPAYDRTVERLPYDPLRAEELLAEAGWYDRDGDGILDKDGVPFEFEFLVVNANGAGVLLSQKLQESLAKLGIEMNIVTLEWATFLERVTSRQFDAASHALALSVPEYDPEALLHSAGAGEAERGLNYSGVADPQVDALIRKGQRELDDEKRWAVWRELHRYLHERVQPFLFTLAPPRKFAMSQRFRGVQSFVINPGYSIRRWYLPAGTPGTRATRERSPAVPAGAGRD